MRVVIRTTNNCNLQCNIECTESYKKTVAFITWPLSKILLLPDYCIIMPQTDRILLFQLVVLLAKTTHQCSRSVF